MVSALTLEHFADIIKLHPAEFSRVARQGRVNIDDMAHAMSRMAVDHEVARTVVALSTGTQRDEVAGGFGCLLQAMAVMAATLAAHPADEFARVFYRAIDPTFGREAGSIQ